MGGGQEGEEGAALSVQRAHAGIKNEAAQVMALPPLAASTPPKKPYLAGPFAVPPFPDVLVAVGFCACALLQARRNEAGREVREGISRECVHKCGSGQRS